VVNCAVPDGVALDPLRPPPLTGAVTVRLIVPVRAAAPEDPATVTV
jgi:hypothetical protein